MPRFEFLGLMCLVSLGLIAQDWFYNLFPPSLGALIASIVIPVALVGGTLYGYDEIRPDPEAKTD